MEKRVDGGVPQVDFTNLSIADKNEIIEEVSLPFHPHDEGPLLQSELTFFTHRPTKHPANRLSIMHLKSAFHSRIVHSDPLTNTH